MQVPAYKAAPSFAAAGGVAVSYRHPVGQPGRSSLLVWKAEETSGAPIRFQPGVFHGREGAGQLHIEIVFGPGFFVDALHLCECVAQLRERLAHLLRVAAGREFCFIQETNAAGKVL